MTDTDPRKPYVVNIGGMDHTLLLDEETAAGYGDRAVPVKAAAPSNKANTPTNKSKA